LNKSNSLGLIKSYDGFKKLKKVEDVTINIGKLRNGGSTNSIPIKALHIDVNELKIKKIDENK
jgi:hypothetical protein